jgi:hypothetical protein
LKMLRGARACVQLANLSLCDSSVRKNINRYIKERPAHVIKLTHISPRAPDTLGPHARARARRARHLPAWIPTRNNPEPPLGGLAVY